MVKEMRKMRVNSMTGFATMSGAGLGHEWHWDIRSVNGKTLDLRLRLPDWIESLEPIVRKEISAVCARGNLSVSLKVSRLDQGQGISVSDSGLAAALSAIAAVETAALERSIPLAPLTSAEVLNLRGVAEMGQSEFSQTAELRKVVLEPLPQLLIEFPNARRDEGQLLASLIAGQIDKIEQLVEVAREAAVMRRSESDRAFKAALARVMHGAIGADPDRVAQELAILAVKADITEEIDRLGAHIIAARALLHSADPIGRKFEFLSQEFVREANTLCSKSGSSALTAIGLDLKHTIDQMREQIMNVE
jgi:uncharacterized protein (TIGR00255 family)